VEDQFSRSVNTTAFVRTYPVVFAEQILGERFALYRPQDNSFESIHLLITTL
jgi:hypothetical protein